MLSRNRISRFVALSAAGGILLLILPLFFKNNNYILTILMLSMVWAIYGMSWDVLFGYTGLLCFGQLLFAGVAIYTVALLKINFDLSLPLLIMAGLTAALISGLVLGLITCRVRHAYFSLTTFALILILERITFSYSNIFGGEYGISINRAWGVLEMYYVVALVFFVTLIVLWLVLKSKIGLALKSIREDEETARAVGINVSALRIFACLLSAFFTGAGGICYLYILEWVGSTIFNMMNSFQVVISSIIGGPGYIFGAALGCGGLSIFFEAMRPISEWRNLVYAVMLIVVILIFQKGIWDHLVSMKHSKSKNDRCQPIRIDKC